MKTSPKETFASERQQSWGIVSDAHGNPYGLKACLEALADSGATEFYFLGDAVGYLPLEAKVLSMLREWPVCCNTGNHEAMLLGDLDFDLKRDEVYGLNSARARLDDNTIDWLRSWPLTNVVKIPERHQSVLMVHGGPDDPLRDYIYPDTALTGFDRYGYHTIFLGQTHRPFVRTAGNTLVVNVGSCGLPRDVGDLASCALYRPAENHVEILRVHFDRQRLLDDVNNVASIHDSVRDCLFRRADAETNVTGVIYDA